jgi:hypothetical protein
MPVAGTVTVTFTQLVATKGIKYFHLCLFSLLVIKKSNALVINKATVKMICHALKLPS